MNERATPRRLIQAYDVVENGTKVANRREFVGREFVDCGNGTADDRRADVDSNYGAAWGTSEQNDVVIVLAPDGKQIAHVRLPERCANANLCFGSTSRSRLLMTANRSIYALYVNTRGATTH